MAESTRTRRSNTRDDPRSANAEEMVEVNLRRSVGRRGTPLYGPGVTKIPRSLYESIKLSPDLVETDGAGNPLPHTVAASVAGATTSSSVQRDAHPIPARDAETGDLIETDEDDAPVSDIARRAAAIAEHAEDGPDRQGGQTASESGSLDDTKRGLMPLPGQTEATREQSDALDADKARDRARGAGAGRGATAASKPMTKTELRGQDEDVLLDLARKNNVRVGKNATKKQLVDKLYNAQVTLD